jgi:DNA-binding transcriptional ArsR family regulator
VTLVLRKAHQAQLLLDPTRRALLEALIAEPGSASGLARKLGLPRQRLNYHLRELEKQGLVELVEERRRGNCTERVVKAVARAFLISPEALGRLGDTRDEARDRWSAGYLMSAAAQALREVAAAGAAAREAGKRVATLTLEADVRFRSAAERSAFAEELAGALAGLVAKYHAADAAGGRTFRLLAASWPEPPAEPAGPPAARSQEAGP